MFVVYYACKHNTKRTMCKYENIASFPCSSLENLIWILLSIAIHARLSTIVINIKLIRARARHCIYYLKNNTSEPKFMFLHTCSKIRRFVYSFEMTSLVKGSKARQFTYFQSYVVSLVLSKWYIHLLCVHSFKSDIY